MRSAFFGTPEFAVPTLRALAATDHTLAVFTPPDRPVGRKAVLTPPPVKAAALELGLPIYQFEKIRSAEGCDAIRAFAPDLYEYEGEGLFARAVFHECDHLEGKVYLPLVKEPPADFKGEE